LLFLYKHVLDKELPAKINVLWAKKPERLPTVLTRQEVWQIIDKLSGVHHLMATLLYGTGMRLMECIRLRVKDVDFGQNLILIRDAKGDKDRITMLPESTREPLQKQLAWAKTLHDYDLSQGYGMVYLPDALERKYPNANKEWGWQYVFPADKYSVDPRSDIKRRHHYHENSLQKSVKQATLQTGITKHVTVRLSSRRSLSHLSPLLCYSFTGRWVCGSPLGAHGSRTVRSQRCQHHPNLYPCSQPRWVGCAQPCRSP
jgi:integrase